MTTSLRPSAVSMPELGSNLKSTTLSPARRTVSKRKMPAGKGLIDWIRLCRSKGTDLTGVGGVRITVTPEQLSQHNKEEDCWTAVRGVVYNITAYLSFHPGSVNELMKGAGIDCTALFNNAHAHVRISQTLAACIVGELVLPPSTTICPASPMTALSLDLAFTGSEEAADSVTTVSPASNNESSIATLHEVPNERTDEPDSGVTSEIESRLNLTGASHQNMRRNSRGCRDRPSPSYKLEQNDDAVLLTINTQTQLLKPSQIITRVVDYKYEALVQLEEWLYKITLNLKDREVDQSTVTIKDSTAVITLRKKLSNNWSDLQELLLSDLIMPRTEHSNKFVSCTLKAVESVTHNSKLFTFQLPPTSHMVVPDGYHVRLCTKDGLIRSYTPVTKLLDDDEGTSTIQLLVKLYSDGRMSRCLSSLTIGDEVLLGEPEGNFNGEQFDASNEVVLLAGGTGFTPMMKLVNRHLRTHPTKPCRLIFFNRTPSDIYYWSQLSNLEAQYPNFSVIHCLSNAGADWQGAKGRLNKELLEEHLPKPAAAQHLYMCGPIEFTQALITMLMELDYPDGNIHPFT